VIQTRFTYIYFRFEVENIDAAPFVELNFRYCSHKVDLVMTATFWIHFLTLLSHSLIYSNISAGKMRHLWISAIRSREWLLTWAYPLHTWCHASCVLFLHGLIPYVHDVMLLGSYSYARITHAFLWVKKMTKCWNTPITQSSTLTARIQQCHGLQSNSNKLYILHAL